jgi:hypothetical protein
MPEPHLSERCGERPDGRSHPSQKLRSSQLRGGSYPHEARASAHRYDDGRNTSGPTPIGASHRSHDRSAGVPAAHARDRRACGTPGRTPGGRNADDAYEILAARPGARPLRGNWPTPRRTRAGATPGVGGPRRPNWFRAGTTLTLQPDGSIRPAQKPGSGHVHHRCQSAGRRIRVWLETPTQPAHRSGGPENGNFCGASAWRPPARRKTPRACRRRGPPTEASQENRIDPS